MQEGRIAAKCEEFIKSMQIDECLLDRRFLEILMSTAFEHGYRLIVCQERDGFVGYFEPHDESVEEPDDDEAT